MNYVKIETGTQVNKNIGAGERFLFAFYFLF